MYKYQVMLKPVVQSFYHQPVLDVFNKQVQEVRNIIGLINEAYRIAGNFRGTQIRDSVEATKFNYQSRT